MASAFEPPHPITTFSLLNEGPLPAFKKLVGLAGIKADRLTTRCKVPLIRQILISIGAIIEKVGNQMSLNVGVISNEPAISCRQISDFSSTISDLCDMYWYSKEKVARGALV